MQKSIKYILFFFIIQSCATKKYIDREQLKGPISNITEKTYNVQDEGNVLVTRKEMRLTKNGRIKYSETFDANNKKIETTEKKLFFEKKSFPDKEAYYCKTRWKPGLRERISCYSQKRYKQNEIIAHYLKDGRIDFIIDNFTTFYKHSYQYNKNNKLLKTVTITSNNAKPIEEVIIKCLTKDNYNNCTQIEKNYSKAKTKELIERTYNYD
ncbi:hypothetical protein [uncultured Lacinutrix sp.]|uniref:hypothetical protein n=1 Tax=uncultured Lacinutrix sp. TaxID=574032 RepID=UPI00261FA6E6|nr:hypothetical protein [uncultured Lacinutrix sp.]